MVPTLFLPLSERRRLSRFARKLAYSLRCGQSAFARCNFSYKSELIFVDAHISPIDHREGFCGNIMQP